MIEQTTTNQTLQWLIHFAPMLKQLLSSDVSITISDLEKVIYHIPSNEFKISNDSVGQTIRSDEPMYKVMQLNRVQVIDVPKEAYGIALKVAVAPIHGDKDEVIGSIAIVTSLSNHSKLMHVAQQFAASSEQISASTEELASSATDFNTYMNHLSNAQSDMSKQVDHTTKILEMINSVAKNTRILGFNAGIEAARSGEYGRGFSVVAKEITKLAEQSASSVNEIRTLLDQLKDKVNQVASIVKDTVEIANNQSTAITEISQTITHLTDIAEEIEDMAKKL
ncbi:methyl-accepting chemotaxis protein [Ureibacillus sp. NPDC094379]